MLAFIGSRTTQQRRARGLGLSAVHIDGRGTWQTRHVLHLTNPSYLLGDPDRRTLYAVHGDHSEISALAVDDDGRMRILNQQSTHGRNPVHLAWNDSRSHLLIANYATGAISCLPVAPDGRLGEAVSTLHFTGIAGPRRGHQTGSHPHQLVRWPGTNLFIVPDKGLDRVHLVALDACGRLQLQGAGLAAPGAGCRHAVVDAERHLLWVANELDTSVTTWQVDLGTRRLAALGTTALAFGDRSGGHSSAAGIVRQGDRLYVSVRGTNTVVVLQIPVGRSPPTVVQTLATGGRTPRFITVAPGGRSLWVAHEDSDDIVQCPLLTDGSLGAPHRSLQTGSPVCIAFLDPTTLETLP